MQTEPMKPIIILPPDAMNSTQIAMLRQNGLCVVTAKDPAAVKFLDPLPAVSARGKIEQAAIALSRKVMSKGFWSNDDTRALMAKTFIDLLVEGTPLDPNPSPEEQEKKIFSQAKIEEIRRLAIQEAREERAAAKAAKLLPPKV